MESHDKFCILNVALDFWYPKGQQRLIDSLRNNGYTGDILSWTAWPNGNYNPWPYNCKASAIEEAIERGYNKFLWIDCSCYALKNIQPIIDIITEEGHYFIDNGYKLSQTCSDKCLEYFGISRDEADKMTEVATTMFGMDMSNPKGREFAHRFIQATKAGAAQGSRNHANQSRDRRFLFHRQDQSVASVIFNTMGFDRKYSWGDHLEYEPSKATEKTLMTLRGMIYDGNNSRKQI